jgi:hypothetical protein
VLAGVIAPVAISTYDVLRIMFICVAIASVIILSLAGTSA